MKTFYVILATCAVLSAGCRKDETNAATGTGTVTYEGVTGLLSRASETVSGSIATMIDAPAAGYTHSYTFSSEDGKNRASMVIVSRESELTSGEYYLTKFVVHVAGDALQSEISATDLLGYDTALLPPDAKISLSYTKTDRHCVLELNHTSGGSHLHIIWEGTFCSEPI